MIIEKLNIKAFGRLRDYELELSPGVNIIEGENESGKSTLCAFIKFIFYGIPAKERATLVSWSDSRADGSLTFSVDGHRYRVERSLTPNGERQSFRESLQIIDLADNSPCHKGESPGELFFGPDADMFAATAFVSQLGNSTGGAKVAEGIENLLFSADETVNTQRALSKLDAARVKLLHKNGSGGRLYELDTECAELEGRLATALKTHDEIAKKESKLADLRKNASDNTKKAELLRRKLSQFELRTIARFFARMHEYERQTAELRQKLDASGAPDPELINKLRGESERLASLRSDYDSAESACTAESLSPSELKFDPKLDEYTRRGGADGINAEYSTLKSKSSAFAFGAAATLVIGVVAAVLPFLLPSILPKLIAVIGAVIAAIGVTLFILSARSRSAAAKLYEEFDVDTLENELAARCEAEETAKYAARARDEAKKRYEEFSANLSRELGLTGASDDDIAAALTARLNELTSQLGSAENLKAEYDKSSERLGEMREQLSRYNEADVTAAVDMSIDISDIDKANYNDMKRLADFCEKSSASLGVAANATEKELAGLYPVSENPAKLSDRLEALKRERESLRAKHAAYLLAYDKLVEASENLRRSVSPRLSADASKLLGAVTGGKYTEVGVGGELELSALTESGTKPINSLSTGTRDAAYLCLRFALTRLVFTKCTPPMIFDESFAHIDDKRLAILLRIVATQEQSIILTSNSRDADIMRALGEFSLIKM